MALVPHLVGLATAVLAAGLVYVDAERRSLPPRSRRRWAASVGLVGVGGVLAWFAFDDAAFRAYLALRGEPMVVTSPAELLAVTLLAELGIVTAAVLAYGVGSRRGPLKPA